MSLMPLMPLKSLMSLKPRTLLSAALLLSLAGTTFAQRLPDPPAPERPRGTARASNLDEFLPAYARAGRPRLLIYTDVVTRAGGASKTLNDAAAATRLGARLEDMFRAPDVTIINPDAAALVAGRQEDALRRNDEFAAARMLGDAARADMVLYVRLLETGGDEYAASYTLADLRRGTSLGRHSWDMLPDPYTGRYDAVRMGEYADSIATRVGTQLAEAYPIGYARPLTLRIVGDYEDDDLGLLRTALETIPGVRPGSVILRADDQSTATSLATFDIAYAGDLLDLRTGARRAVVERLGMDADVIDSREGGLDIRLSPLAPGGRERLLAGGGETPRNAAERRRLADAYDAAGRPTIAVVINRAAVDDEAPLVAPPGDAIDRGAAPLQEGDGTNIILGDRIGNGFDRDRESDRFRDRVIDRELRDRRQDRQEDAVIDLRVLEDEITGRLLDLGLRARDVSAARASLTREDRAGTPAGPSKDWTDREVAHALGSGANADIVLSGVGRLVRDRATGRPVRVVVSLRAYETATGDVLAATSVQRALDDGAQSFDRSVADLAAEATGALATKMADRWSR